MKRPLLTVMTPNYNHGHYLKESLPFLLSEANEEVEFLILDDASTDASVALVEEWGKKDPRIRLLKNEKNRGVNFTANRGLREAKGEFFFSLAADDRLLPGFFSRVLPLLKAHPEIGFCCSDPGFFCETDLNFIDVDKLLIRQRSFRIFSPEETMQLFLKTHLWIPGHSSLFRTEHFLEAGGYDETLKQASDFFINHKIALTYPFAYLPESYCAMKMSATSFSAQCAKNKEALKVSYRNVLEKAIRDPCKRAFQRSTVFRPQVKLLFWEAVRSPRYWGFLFPALRRFFRRKAGSFFFKFLKKQAYP